MPNKDDTSSAQDNVCFSATEAGRKVRELVDHASHEALDAVAATEKQIRSNPVVASAVAVGIGFLLGSLFRRR